MAVDPITIATLAEKAPAIVKGIIDAAESADADRVVICRLENHTNHTFVYKKGQTPDGVWIKDKEPPHQIPPRSAAFWGGQDSGWYTGTKGFVSYIAVDALPDDNTTSLFGFPTSNDLRLECGWDNPFLGGGDENYIRAGRFLVKQRGSGEDVPTNSIFLSGLLPVDDAYYTEIFVSGRKDGRANLYRLIDR